MRKVGLKPKPIADRTAGNATSGSAFGTAGSGGGGGRMPTPQGSQKGAPGQMNPTKRTKGGYTRD